MFSSPDSPSREEPSAGKPHARIPGGKAEWPRYPTIPSLGGDGPMRGYYPGRLVDQSAAAAVMHYVWPIGPWLGGSLAAALGNVWGEHLSGFRLKQLRFSGDVGISSLVASDYPIELVFGVGSETFDQGGKIDSFRVALSVNHGF